MLELRPDGPAGTASGEAVAPHHRVQPQARAAHQNGQLSPGQNAVHDGDGGLAVSSILTAASNTITLLAPDSLAGASNFMLGGFSGVTLAAVGRSGWYLAAGAALALFLSTELNVLQLGEESAASLGLHVGRVRLLAILAAALLAGAAVSFSGLLGFVGLLVPHMARRLVGSDNRWLLPAAALLGGAFVLLCDVLARVLFAPFELPVGIVMSLLGGPFFLYLLLRRKGGRVYA